MRICYLQSHYISHFRAGIAYVQCLEASGVALVDQPADADVVVIHNEPWTLPGYYRAFPELKQKYVVAYSVWETSLLPEYYRLCLGLVDEIWTPSSYSCEIFARDFNAVFIIPHIVTPPVVDPRAIAELRARIGYQDGMFYFYSITKSRDPRKNVKALLRAFKSLVAFKPARLLLKTHSPLPPELAEAPGVIPLCGESGDREIQALHRLGHCFVSPHCSEAWGMAIAEAMSHGKIVIATGFGGNMDYMNRDNSLPVKFTVENIREEDLKANPVWLKPEMQWAYVDEDDLRSKMTGCLDGSIDFQPLALRAQQEIRRFSPQNMVSLLQKRLHRIVSGQRAAHRKR